MIQDPGVKASFRGAKKESACQYAGVVLRRALAHGYDAPGEHNPTHPHIRTEVLQHERRKRLEEHVGVVKDAQRPGPL